jgi:streptogramin lyase
MRFKRFFTAGFLALATCVGVAGAAPLGSVTEFSDGLNQNALFATAIAAGPDGNIWFADKGSPGVPAAVGLIDPATGAIDRFSVPEHGGNPGSFPNSGLVAGPDGNVWFTDSGPTKAIGMIDPATHAVSEFSSGLNPGSIPQAIGLGPDGKVWFTDRGTTRAIGVIDPTTHAISEFTIVGNQSSLPVWIQPGPDGDLWFTEENPAAIGRIDPTSHAITFYTSGLNPRSNPLTIAPGPDGNLWFTDPGSPRAIGKVDPANGTITEFNSVWPTVSAIGGNTLSLSEPATGSGTGTLQFSILVTTAVTAGSNVATVVSGPVTSLFPGMQTGGIYPPGTTIVSISGSTLTLSQPAIGSNPAGAQTFYTSVADVTTTAGSADVSVSSGGFPLVAVGDQASGPGLPTGILNPAAQPLGIAEGPDGNMWFSDGGISGTPTTPAVGMIDPATSVITEFTRPVGMNAGSHPIALTAGPDGNLWFTDQPTSAVSPKAVARFGLGLCGDSLVGCNLKGANLQNIILPGARLQGANLKGAQLENAHLVGADLQDANLLGAQFQSYALLSLANLRGANLNGADLTGANLSGADLEGANLRKATLTGVVWSNTTCPDGTNSDDDGGTCP